MGFSAAPCVSNATASGGGAGCSAGKLQGLIDCFTGRAIARPVQHMIVAENNWSGYSGLRPQTPQRTNAAYRCAKISGIPARSAQLYRSCLSQRLSFGKICDGVGVGVGTAALLEPPQPAIPINSAQASRIPEIFDMMPNLFDKSSPRFRAKKHFFKQILRSVTACYPE